MSRARSEASSSAVSLILFTSCSPWGQVCVCCAYVVRMCVFDIKEKEKERRKKEISSNLKCLYLLDT